MCVTVFLTSVYADWAFSLLVPRIPWHLFVLFCSLKWTNLNLELSLFHDPSTCYHTVPSFQFTQQTGPFSPALPFWIHDPSNFMIIKLYLFVCLYAHARAHMRKSENNIQEVFSSLIRWVLGIKLGSSGLMTYLSHFFGLQNPSNLGSPSSEKAMIPLCFWGTVDDQTMPKI